jgi:hypothetical protein
MKILKILILILLSIVFMIFSLIYISIMGIEKTFLNQNYYEGLVYEVDIFSDIHENLIDIFPIDEDEEDSDETGALATEILVGNMSKRWLEEQFLNITDGLLRYIDGKDEKIMVTIDLREQKELLVKDLATNLQETDLVHDEFSELQPDVIASEIAEEGGLPDEIHVNEILEESLSSIENSVNIFRTVREYFHFGSYILFGTILLLMSLLAGISSGFKCYGISMIIPGFFYSVPLLIFRDIMDTSSINISEELPMTEQTVLAIFEYTLNSFIKIGAFYALIGVLIVILGIVWKRIKKRNKN